MVTQVVIRDHGKCHICLHWNAYSADHLVPDTEGGQPVLSNLKAAHGYPKGCPDCSAAAGKPIYCNEIRSAMSVERARRIIEERTGLTLSETGPFQPEGRDVWLF